jgi:hypothetical protein
MRETLSERKVKVSHFATIIATLIFSFVDAGVISAQGPASAGAQARSQAIAASFSKFKNVSKEKNGVTKTKYLKVESQPAVKSNPEDYSGTYAVPDLGFALRLQVDHSGKVEGTGYEPIADPAVRRMFALRDGRIEGALITATKVYANGRSERLEGVFIDRTTFESPTDKGSTRFGLGVIGKPVEVSGLTLDKLFFELVENRPSP